MSLMSNRAIRTTLPPAETVAYYGSYYPTCPQCQSMMTVHDIQIHLAEEPQNPRFPRDADEPPLRYNRLDLPMYCKQCGTHAHLIVMPTADNGELDYFYDVLTRREDTV
jgi:hypothetical protein